MTERYGQDVIDDLREAAGTLPSNLRGKSTGSIEQRWDELDTLLLGSKPGGTRLDGETAECVKRLLLAVLVAYQDEHYVQCDKLCCTLKRVEALEIVETPDPDVQLSLLGEA